MNPTAGYEAGGEVSQALGRSLEVSLRRKVSQSEENVSREDGTSFLQPSARYLMRYEGLWHAPPDIVPAALRAGPVPDQRGQLQGNQPGFRNPVEARQNLAPRHHALRVPHRLL